MRSLHEGAAMMQRDGGFWVPEPHGTEFTEGRRKAKWCKTKRRARRKMLLLLRRRCKCIPLSYEYEV